MPIYCFRKPNRTKKRHFKACDAARIAREVVKDSEINETPEMVLACIAKGLGFKKISLSREAPKEISAGVNLKKSINLIKVVLETTEKLASKLKLFEIAAKIKLAIEAIDNLSRLIDEAFFEPEQIDAEELLPPTYCNCKR